MRVIELEGDNLAPRSTMVVAISLGVLIALTNGSKSSARP
jgi:hypothetical protein